MSKLLWMSSLALMLMCFVGCDSGSGQATSTVENAEQSAIDAYNAAQKADQEAMDSSLGTPNAAEAAEATQ